MRPTRAVIPIENAMGTPIRIVPQKTMAKIIDTIQSFPVSLI